jgi:hypothetical protein
MKKLLFIMVVGFGGTMLVRSGQVTVTPDNQVRVAGYSMPLPAVIQNSPVMGMVITALVGQTPGQQQPAGQMAIAGARPGAQVPHPRPSVTSTAGTYNANPPSTGPTQGQPKVNDQFSAVAKALHGSQ